jgi:hypothetical protein
MAELTGGDFQQNRVDLSVLVVVQSCKAALTKD